MFSKLSLATVAIAVVALVAPMAGPATAQPARHTGFHLSITSAKCKDNGAGGPPGGELSIRATGSETRLVGQPFRTNTLMASGQVEKYVGGTWLKVFVIDDGPGNLGAATRHGNLKSAPFVWWGQAKSVRIKADVGPHALYRMVLVIYVYGADGSQVGMPIAVGPSCTFS